MIKTKNIVTGLLIGGIAAWYWYKRNKRLNAGKLVAEEVVEEGTLPSGGGGGGGGGFTPATSAGMELRPAPIAPLRPTTVVSQEGLAGTVVSGGSAGSTSGGGSIVNQGTWVNTGTSGSTTTGSTRPTQIYQAEKKSGFAGQTMFEAGGLTELD
jgi:hypothetical protein